MLQIFGNIDPPGALSRYANVEDGGLGQLLNIVFNILIIGAGVYAVFNLVLAGYGFISAGDEPKKIEMAWAKIWQTVMGLVITAGAFTLAAIFSWLIYGDPGRILNPSIPTVP